MNEEYRKMLSEMIGCEIEFKGWGDAFESDGLEYNLVTSFILCKHLKRIADNLEKIAACVDGREDSRFFSVGGEMDICR